jgi:membrane protease YdiL (CAAX protease family)
MTQWLRAHPVAGFVLITFGVSYLVGMPLLMGVTGMIPPDAYLVRGYLPRIGVTYGPAVAALLLARLSGTPRAAADLLRRALPTRRDLPWSIGIVVVGVGLASLALAVAGVRGAEQLAIVRAHGGLLAAHFTLQLLVVALGEEIGWRGWLLPTLAARTTRLRATVAVAAIWGAWHAPLLFSGFVAASMFLLGVLGLSVIFTALWARAGHRLFTVVLAHATVNAPLFFMEQLVAARGPGDGRVVLAWRVLQGTYAVAALVIVGATWRWWRAREPHIDVAT